MKTIAEGHIHKPLFQQTEAGGQSQGIAQLHQTVIVIVDRIRYKPGKKVLVPIRHIENADG